MPIEFVDDLKNLELPDGRSVKTVDLHELRRVLEKLGVPVSHSEGHYDLARKYRAWKDAEQEAAADELKRVRGAA